MNDIKFTFSDTIAGYVTDYNTEKDELKLKTSDEREFAIKLKGGTYSWIIYNLGAPVKWCDPEQIRSMLVLGRHLFVYGIYYPEGGGHVFEAQYIIFCGARPGEYPFEKQDWWGNQIAALGEFYLHAQFGDTFIDYHNYRTTITLTGEKEKDNYRQETHRFFTFFRHSTRGKQNKKCSLSSIF